jgi:hypothetical protein
MFRELLAHLQEAQHKRKLLYCVHIMSVGSGTVAVQLQPAVWKLVLRLRFFFQCFPLILFPSCYCIPLFLSCCFLLSLFCYICLKRVSYVAM